jgi:hypothetical protein
MIHPVPGRLTTTNSRTLMENDIETIMPTAGRRGEALSIDADGPSQADAAENVVPKPTGHAVTAG